MILEEIHTPAGEQKNNHQRRPSSLVRYRHGGLNALFPLTIDGVRQQLLSEEEITPIPNKSGAKIIDIRKFRKNIKK